MPTEAQPLRGRLVLQALVAYEPGRRADPEPGAPIGALLRLARPAGPSLLGGLDDDDAGIRVAHPSRASPGGRALRDRPPWPYAGAGLPDIPTRDMVGRKGRESRGSRALSSRPATTPWRVYNCILWPSVSTRVTLGQLKVSRFSDIEIDSLSNLNNISIVTVNWEQPARFFGFFFWLLLLWLSDRLGIELKAKSRVVVSSLVASLSDGLSAYKASRDPRETKGLQDLGNR